MNNQEFFGMTVNVANGKTYWQAGGFATVAELVYHEDKKRELGDHSNLR